MTEIRLNVINHSNDSNNVRIVIFQENSSPSADDLTSAWHVIPNLAQGGRHTFTYSSDSTINVTDRLGNDTAQLTAEAGQRFDMVKDAGGESLKLDGAASSPEVFEVANSTQDGPISANVYKSGKLLASKQHVAPGQKAIFEFKPSIYIGVDSGELQEGQIMNSAILSDINTELSLLGIASADIVMTGGGPGASSQAYEFTLDNVVYA